MGTTTTCRRKVRRHRLSEDSEARIDFTRRIEHQYGERRQADSERPLVEIDGFLVPADTKTPNATHFVLSDVLAHESGLLAVVVMGLVLANKDVPRIKEILSFKESLSVLLISILFILLAANINMSELRLLTEDWRPIALFGFVALILRPISVFASP